MSELEIVQAENQIARTAGEVFDFVREKLAPVVTEERAKVDTVIAEAKSIEKVESASDYESAVDMIKRLKGVAAEGSSRLEDMKKKAHSVHKAFTTSQNDITADVAGEEARLKTMAVKWDREEKARLEAERRRLEEEQRKAEEERRLQEAAELEAQGKTEEAEAVIDEPIHTAPVPPPVAAPKVKGASTSSTWKFEIVDQSKIPASYMIPNEKAIQAVVTAMKGNTNIPGIKVYEDFNMRVSAK